MNETADPFQGLRFFFCPSISQPLFKRSRCDAKETRIRTILGELGIREEMVYRKVGDLSIGERSKVEIALVLLSQANFLLLDEPTNHLDLPMRETLEAALEAFSGTILFVSHDRYFLERMATRVVEV